MNAKTDNGAIIGANIRKLLSARGWSENELSRRARVSQKMVNNICNVNFDANPTLESLEKIAKALNVPVWKLMIPGQTVEQLQNVVVNELVEHAITMDAEAASYVLTVAKRETRRG